LPHAILNYLLLLGWSFDGETEFFSREEMIEHFSLERINRAPASFDPQKLLSFQQHYMNQVPTVQKVSMVLPYLHQSGLVPDPTPAGIEQKVTQIVTAAGDRIRVAGDILDYEDFFTADDQLTYDEKAFDKRIRNAPEAAELLTKFKSELAGAEPFTAEHLDQVLHAFVESEGIKIAQLIHPLRVATTGKAVGFGLFDTLAILGRDACLARIDQALARLDG